MITLKRELAKTLGRRSLAATSCSLNDAYISIKTDWLYLVAIIDRHSRYILSWSLGDTLEIDFALNACLKALERGKPEIMNSDQGGCFTSPRYTEIFINVGVQISMDRRGRAYDAIFIERLWRTVKYENVYLRSYETPREARLGINGYLKRYNSERPHSSLNIERRKACI